MRDLALVRRHHALLLDLRAKAGERVGALWDAYGGLTDEQQAAFVAQAVPVVAGAQRHAVTLMLAYLSSLLGSPPAGVDPLRLFGAAVRGGADPTIVYGRPSVTSRVAISRGADYAAAFRQGRDRATTLAETDVMLSNRAAASDAFSAEPRIVGYTRVLSGRACAFCATASTQLYHSEDLLPLHDHCDCDVAPIIGDRNPGRIINGELLGKLKEAGPQYWKAKGFVDDDGNPVDPVDAPGSVPVATREHGELGPVLVDPRDHFTGPDAID